MPDTILDSLVGEFHMIQRGRKGKILKLSLLSQPWAVYIHKGGNDYKSIKGKAQN